MSDESNDFSNKSRKQNSWIAGQSQPGSEDALIARLQSHGATLEQQREAVKDFRRRISDVDSEDAAATNAAAAAIAAAGDQLRTQNNQNAFDTQMVRNYQNFIKNASATPSYILPVATPDRSPTNNFPISSGGPGSIITGGQEDYSAPTHPNSSQVQARSSQTSHFRGFGSPDHEGVRGKSSAWDYGRLSSGQSFGDEPQDAFLTANDRRPLTADNSEGFLTSAQIEQSIAAQRANPQTAKAVQSKFAKDIFNYDDTDNTPAPDNYVPGAAAYQLSNVNKLSMAMDDNAGDTIASQNYLNLPSVMIPALVSRGYSPKEAEAISTAYHTNRNMVGSGLNTTGGKEDYSAPRSSTFKNEISSFGPTGYSQPVNQNSAITGGREDYSAPTHPNVQATAKGHAGFGAVYYFSNLKDALLEPIVQKQLGFVSGFGDDSTDIYGPPVSLADPTSIAAAEGDTLTSVYGPPISLADPESLLDASNTQAATAAIQQSVAAAVPAAPITIPITLTSNVPPTSGSGTIMMVAAAGLAIFLLMGLRDIRSTK